MNTANNTVNSAGWTTVRTPAEIVFATLPTAERQRLEAQAVALRPWTEHYPIARRALAVQLMVGETPRTPQGA